jgi:hypothetical protein
MQDRLARDLTFVANVCVCSFRHRLHRMLNIVFLQSAIHGTMNTVPCYIKIQKRNETPMKLQL